MSCSCPKGDELYAIIEKNIKESGWHGFYIYNRKDPRKTFFYTVGLVERGLPELFMGVNCRPEVGMRVMDDIISHMTEHGVKYERNDDILQGMDIQLSASNPESSIEHYMVQLGEYYGKKDIPVVQVLMPDEDGKLPYEVGYDMPQVMLEPITMN